jgi:transposase
MRDYTNKTIYLGIDVHKKSYSITAICEGEVVKKDKLTACPETLITYCKRFFAKAKIISAYEAGFCGFHLHRFLTKHGFKNLVVHPASIEVGSRDRVKTDKRDSLKIATQLSVGRLESIYIPSEDQEYQRLITRARETLIRKRTRVACQIKSILNLFGLIPWNNTQKTCKTFIQKILALACHPDLKFSLTNLCNEWLYMTNEIKTVDKHLNLQNLNNPLLMIYLSAPGIGSITAKNLLNELGDMSQFSNESQLFSYLGLTPSQHSSGEVKHLGHISHQGKSIFRKLLTQVAWKTIKKDETLAQYYEKLANRVGSKRAIIAVARKLLGRVRACIRDKILYKTINNESVSVETGELIQTK